MIFDEGLLQKLVEIMPYFLLFHEQPLHNTK